MLYPIENQRRQRRDLNGIWRFLPETEEGQGRREGWKDGLPSGTREMPVPASYNDIGVDRSLRDHVGKVWYERDMTVPEAWLNERIVLRFGAAAHHAAVYVNGREVMRHKGGFLPFEAEVTAVVHAGRNRLTVELDNILDWTCLPVGWLEEGVGGERVQRYNFDFFHYAGLHRPVVLYTTPRTYISDVTVVTDILEGGKGRIVYETAVEGGSVPVEVSAFDAQGNRAASAEGAKGELVIPDAVLWEPGKPYLYELEIRAGEDLYTVPVGIRTVRVTEKEFLINGKPFYFRGFGKHEDSDIRGKGLDEAVNVRDFELLQWIGANSFRTSHYPYSEELMQMADRRGVVIIDEVPAVGMNFFSRESVFQEARANADTMAYHKEALRELYTRDKNHPSVVMWSVANEPKTDEPGAEAYFGELVPYMKSLDSTRPVTVVINSDVKKDLVGQFLDVVCVNRYFGWYDRPGQLDSIYPVMKKDLEAWWERYHRPIMVTEFGADTVNGIHKLPEVMFTEEFQIRYIQENERAIDECDFIVGEHLWAFADFMTNSDIRRVDGNRKGIFTRQRQPKMAAYFLRKRWTGKDTF